MQKFTFQQPILCVTQSLISGLFLLLFLGYSSQMKAQVYSANFNSSIESWVNGSSSSWSRVSTGGVSNSGCLTSTIVCEEGQQQGSCINETNYFIATPSVSLTGGNTYQISIKCSVATASTRKLVLGVNTSQARSGATSIQNFGYVSTGSYTTFTVNYTPASTGSPYFVLWGEKFTTQSVGLWLDDFAVTLVNSAPTISLSSPANNSVYNEGASAFTFQASATDAESNLSKVEFYSNGTKVGEKTSSPYSISYIPTVGGSYSLTAKATDSYGANTTSAARTISFRTMPIIEFVTPDLEFPTYAEGPLSLTVNATDADGTVSYVDFYVDGDLVYTDMASPWSYSWSATAGTHDFNAVATDNHGLQSDQNVFPAGFGIEANTCSLSAPTSSSTTICEGASATFTSGYSSLLTGTIQWQRQPSGGSWANISGATSASYSATLAGNYRGVWTFENGATCTTAVDTIKIKPWITLTNPTSSDTVFADDMLLEVTSTDCDKVVEVEFFVDNQSIGIDQSSPYQIQWTGLNGSHIFTAIGRDENNIEFEIETPVTFELASPKVPCSTSDNGFFLLSTQSQNNFSLLRENSERRFQLYRDLNDSLHQVPGWAGDSTVLIPTVFYVIKPDSTASSPTTFLINDQTILDQLEVLNNAYKGSEFKVNEIPTQFRFCLAQQYVDSSGVTRQVSDAVLLDSVELKSNTSGIIYFRDKTNKQRYNKLRPKENSWDVTRKLAHLSKLDATKFLRIFIVEQHIFSGSAFMPYQVICDEVDYISPDTFNLNVPYNIGWRQSADGVVIQRSLIGKKGNVPYQFTNQQAEGKKLIHEVGHYLGLNHTFHNDCAAGYDNFGFSGYTPASDFVKDTPPQKRQSWKGTADHHPNCSDTLWMHNNVKCPGYPNISPSNPMDYVLDSCQGAFSPDQVKRLVYQTSFYRKELIDPQNWKDAGLSCQPYAWFKLSRNIVCAQNLPDTLRLFHDHDSSRRYQFTSNLAANQFDVDTSRFRHDNAVTISLTGVGTLPNPVEFKLRFWYIGGPDSGVTATRFLYSSNLPCSASNGEKGSVFFGQYAGIKWSSDGPAGTADAYVSSNTTLVQKINAFAGSVSVDSVGKLKFYSSGNYIWNKDHKRISTTLFSDDSSTQHGIAVPFPGKTDEYLLITVPATNGPNHAKGLRTHKIKTGVTQINSSTPNLSGSPLNRPVLNNGISPSPATGDNGAIKVADKITAIGNSSDTCSGLFIYVQGAPTDNTYKSRLLCFRVSPSDTTPTYLGYSNAGNNGAKHGTLKASTKGKYLISTSTNADFVRGTGTGPMPVVFKVNLETGVLNRYAKLKIFGMPGDSSSGYGATFAQEEDYVYVSINAAGSVGNVPRAGIYRWHLRGDSAADGFIYGHKVGEFDNGRNPNVQLMTGPDGKIYFPQYHTQYLGIVHNPSSQSSPGYEPTGLSLTSNPSQPLRTWVGLPNFVDANTHLGFTQASAIDLGTNPVATINNSLSCCPAVVPMGVNVECTGNDNIFPNEDIFYKFRVKKMNGVFPYLRVSTTTSDFQVVPTLEYFGNFGLTPFDTSSWNNGPKGNKWVTINSSRLSSWVYGSNDYVDIQLSLDAAHAGDSGMFRLIVNTFKPNIDTTNIFTQQNYPNLSLNCCRLATDNELENPWPFYKPVSNSHSLLRLVPNPAKNQVQLIWKGKEARVELVDALGRTMKAYSQLKENLFLDISDLPTGLYRVKVISVNGLDTQALQIIK